LQQFDPAHSLCKIKAICHTVCWWYLYYYSLCFTWKHSAAHPAQQDFLL